MTINIKFVILEALEALEALFTFQVLLTIKKENTMPTEATMTKAVTKTLKNDWTAVRISATYHKKLSFLSVYHKIKLSHMIEVLIEREYRDNVENIRESL